MPRHHLVPQMLLKRFGDEGGRLAMVPRRGGEQVFGTVRKAAAEAGFYQLEIPEGMDDQFTPEHVENLLSQVEGKAEQLIAAALDGGFPFSNQGRFDFALFLALQITRGWSFRRDLAEIGWYAARAAMAEVTEEHARDWLRSRNLASGHAEVRQFLERAQAMESVKLVPSTSAGTLWMLKHAVEDLQPALYFRSWRLLRFDRPGLLLSDQPVAMWARPSRDVGLHDSGHRIIPLGGHRSPR